MLSGDAANISFIVFGSTRQEPTIYGPRGKYANLYTTDVVKKIKGISHKSKYYVKGQLFFIKLL